MTDQTALQEAIKRARELAGKVKMNNTSVKRTASDLEDSIGTIKVTLAYEKPPPNRDNNNSQHNHQPPTSVPSAPPYNSPCPGVLTGANAFPRGGGTQDEKIEIIIPHAVIGLVIGKGGENIKRIQNETGATVRVDPNTVDEKGNKVCTITGTKQAVEEAHSQVANVIENAATNKRPRMQMEGGEQYRMKIPASRTGAIIGKGGETIKQIKQQSGCDIELDKNAKECGPDESVFVIRGSQDKISKARALIEARLASRGRDGPDQSNRPNPGPKTVATGANAAPVAQFTDLPNAYGGKSITNLYKSLYAYAYIFQNIKLLNSLLLLFTNSIFQLVDNHNRARLMLKLLGLPILPNILACLIRLG